MKKRIAIGLGGFLLTVVSFLGGFRTGTFATELSPEEVRILTDALQIGSTMHSFAATCKQEHSGLTAGAIIIDEQPIALVCVDDPTLHQNSELEAQN